MSRPLALFFAGSAAAALALFLWWSGGEVSAPIAPRAADHVSVGQEEPASAPVAAGTQTVREAVAGTADAERTPIPGDAIRLDVRIVDASTTLPVPSALVRWSTPEASSRALQLPYRDREPFLGNDEHVAEVYGWQTRADGEGIARIVASRSGASLHAYADGRYGTGWVGGDLKVPDGGWQVAIEADRNLLVQVVDAQSLPVAGVQVGIRCTDGDGMERLAAGWIPPRQSRDPDGIAEFHHIQNWLRGPLSAGAETASFHAVLRVPGRDDPGVPFDFVQPPAVPVVLHMTPSGRVRVRLLHLGQPLLADVLFAAWNGDPQNGHKRNLARRWATDADGWARIAPVALGGSLVLEAQLGATQIVKVIDAPTFPGQEVAAELTTDGIYMLAGTMLGPEGQPLSDALVAAEFDAEVSAGDATVRTDAQGRFLWSLTEGYREKAMLRRLVFSRRCETGSPLRAVVASREIARGVNDLGVLHLHPGPLVVAGSFSFSDAMPRQMYLRVECLAAGVGSNGADRWVTAEGLTTAARDDGTFEVRGETQPVRHRLTFPGTQHLPISPIEFRVGTEALVVPVEFGNELEATVLSGPVADSLQFIGVLRASDTANAVAGAIDHAGSLTAHQLQRESGVWPLRWRALPAATYTLEIRVAGPVAALAVVPDVVVPPPKGGDPRLRNIVIEDSVRLVRLEAEFVDDTNPDSGAHVWLFPMPQADPGRWQGFAVSLATGVFPLPPQAMDLVVACPGWRPQRVLCDGDTLRVRLERWGRVALGFPDVAGLPDGFSLTVILPDVQGMDAKARYSTPADGGMLADLLQSRGASARIVDGHAVLPVGDDSRPLSVVLHKEGCKGGRLLHDISPREVAGGSSLAPVTVQLSTDELRKAIAELQAQAK